MEKLRSIVKNHLSEGIVLMDLLHNSSSGFIKITIDSSRDISIEETSNIAKRIKDDDSILSMFPNGFRLEVTTPGVGNNLLKKFQYEKNIGRKVLIKYSKDHSNIVSDTLLLIDVEDEGVIVSNSKKEFSIMFKNIISAKIKVSFD